MATGHPGPSSSDERAARALLELTDAVLGLTVVAVAQARRVTDTMQFVVRPLSALVQVPISAGRSVAGQPWFKDIVESGTIQRWQVADTLRAWAQRVAPPVVGSALEVVDVDAIVASVDVDAIVAKVDMDAILDRIDVDAIVAKVDMNAILDRIDVDAIVAKVDMNAILDRVDVDAIVARVDLDAIIDRIDIDAIVSRVDIDAILDRIDVNAVVGQVDIDAIIARIDILGLSEYVVEGIDLPGIIRSSTGSMASEGIREVRRQGITADERVAHLVDRLLRRQARTPGSVNHEPVAALQPAGHEDDPPEPESRSGPDGEAGA